MALLKCAINTFQHFLTAHGAGNGQQQRLGNVPRRHADAVHRFGCIEVRQFLKVCRTEIRICVYAAPSQKQAADAVLQQAFVNRFYLIAGQPHKVCILINAKQLGQIVRQIVLDHILRRQKQRLRQDRRYPAMCQNGFQGFQ